MRRFRAWRRVRVYYDPAETNRSILMPGFHGPLWLGWLTGLLFLAAAVLLRRYDAWFRRRQARRRQEMGTT